MAEMAKTQVTPRAKHPERTQDFVKAIKEVLDAFEDQVHFPDEEVRSKAYQMLLEAHREALMPVWNLAHFANIDIILNTISDKEMQELSAMTKWLQPPPTTSTVITEDRQVPDLETIITALKDRNPSESLPDAETCVKIGDVFSKISSANRAYAETAEGLAELSTEVTPQQYTMLLMAAAMPTIQIVVPGKLLLPLTAPCPPQPQASTALGRSEIIKYTKLKVLPNPDAAALISCDKNSATRVLAATVYCKLEHLFFDETLSHIDISTAFCSNVSQLTKAVTGVGYKGGLHSYKSKKATKRPSDITDQNPGPAKRKATSAHPTQLKAVQTTGSIIQEDKLLSSSSSNSELPLGLPT